jgi:hypothetical protein
VPVIKVKYAGISGKIQGEKKDNNPAVNAAKYDMDSANIIGLRLTPYGLAPRMSAIIQFNFIMGIHIGTVPQLSTLPNGLAVSIRGSEGLGNFEIGQKRFFFMFPKNLDL